MRIVVLGAGTVGTSIADLLCRHRHSVTVVDEDPARARRINETLDVRAIAGSASQSSVMFQADVLGCDVCLAMTGDDEVNLVAASMAKGLGARRTVARVYATIFRDLSTFDYQRHFKIDRLLSVEQLSALEFAHSIRNPGSVVLEHFGRGELEVQEVVVSPTSSAVGVPLKDLDLPPGVRIGSILRGDRMWIAGAADELQPDDHAVFIGRSEDAARVMESIQRQRGPQQMIVIAGGGETGFQLARTLETGRFSVVLMETEQERCEFLANNLRHTTVVHADCTRRAVLEEERVGNADVFVACTGDDENNIVAGVEAREIGAKRIMAIVGRPDYANIVGKLGIDVAVSERKVMAKQVLGLLNEGAVIQKTSLPGGTINIFELEVLKDAKATEHVLAELPLPDQCLIAAFIRESYVRVPGADDQLQHGDTVVVLVDENDAADMLAQFSVNGR